MSDPPGDKNHLMATIKMDSDVYVTFCSTHTPHAVSLHKRLEAMSGDPSVIVSTSLNPKILGGTHIYFDKETNVGEAFFYKFVATETGLRSELHFCEDMPRLRI
ncbi:hypothetical protein Bca4012_082360 [Brassica carinata]